MLNATSLNSSRTQAQIKSAMKACVRSSLTEIQSVRYISNAKGENYLRVKHRRMQGRTSFIFHAESRDVTNIVLSALRSA